MPVTPSSMVAMRLLACITIVTACRPSGAAKREMPRLYAPSFAEAPRPAAPLSRVANTGMTDSASESAPDATSPSPMIIRTGEASIEVDTVDHAVGAARELARSVGGYVANSSAQTGADNVKSATVQLKVPVAQFDQVLARLTSLGKVESVNVTTQDVGEEYVDVEARVANARRLEERLIALLATRTGKLKDVLDVEQELARVRGQIEQAEGRMRFLRAHAALSTLDVTVHEHAAVLADLPGQHPLRDATHQAWHNFIGVIAAGIASLGVILPLALIVGGAWFAVRRVRGAPAP